MENLHYELTKEDLTELFTRIGPILNIRLTYDKSGRSNGVAYVTFSSLADANEAIREFNGANAAGSNLDKGFK